MSGKYLRLTRGFARQSASPVPSEVYDQTFVPGGTVSSGTAITLPSSGTYDSAELKIELNGQLLEVVIDYNYVGSVPRTQVQMTFNLVLGDRLRFKLGD